MFLEIPLHSEITKIHKWLINNDNGVKYCLYVVVLIQNKYLLHVVKYSNTFETPIMA